MKKSYSMKQVKEAYQIRFESNLPWEKIAKQTGFSSGSVCRKRVLSCIEFGMLQPLPIVQCKSEQAYMMRQNEGLIWEDIKRILNHKSSSSSRWLARQWAYNHGYQWPIKIKKGKQ